MQRKTMEGFNQWNRMLISHEKIKYNHLSEKARDKSGRYQKQFKTVRTTFQLVLTTHIFSLSMMYVSYVHQNKLAFNVNIETTKTCSVGNMYF